MTIKDVVTSHTGSEHNPDDARSVDEVSHLMQTHTLYLNHYLAELMESRVRQRGMRSSPQAYWESGSCSPYWWDSCKNLLLENHPPVVHCVPHVNPHIPVLGETTRGTYVDHSGDERTDFAFPNDGPPSFRKHPASRGRQRRTTRWTSSRLV